MEREYSVVINVMASDVDDAADKAYDYLRDGNTPDAVIPAAVLDPLIAGLINKLDS